MWEGDGNTASFHVTVLCPYSGVRLDTGMETGFSALVFSALAETSFSALVELRFSALFSTKVVRWWDQVTINPANGDRQWTRREALALDDNGDAGRNRRQWMTMVIGSGGRQQPLMVAVAMAYLLLP